MGSLVQGRSIFNPLPLTQDYIKFSTLNIQQWAQNAYATLNGGSLSKEKEVQLHKKINEVMARRLQGLLWSEDLKEKTQQYWSSHAGKFAFTE